MTTEGEKFCCLAEHLPGNNVIRLMNEDDSMDWISVHAHKFFQIICQIICLCIGDERNLETYELPLFCEKFVKNCRWVK